MQVQIDPGCGAHWQTFLSRNAKQNNLRSSLNQKTLQSNLKRSLRNAKNCWRTRHQWRPFKKSKRKKKSKTILSPSLKQLKDRGSVTSAWWEITVTKLSVQLVEVSIREHNQDKTKRKMWKNRFQLDLLHHRLVQYLHLHRLHYVLVRGFQLIKLHRPMQDFHLVQPTQAKVMQSRISQLVRLAKHQSPARGFHSALGVTDRGDIWVSPRKKTKRFSLMTLNRLWEDFHLVHLKQAKLMKSFQLRRYLLDRRLHHLLELGFRLHRLHHLRRQEYPLDRLYHLLELIFFCIYIVCWSWVIIWIDYNFCWDRVFFWIDSNIFRSWI